MTEAPKTSPGLVNMKCMIWEPNPISMRPSQDNTVVYNATTIQRLPESIQNLIQTLEQAPYGIFLKQKYVYRDTFLKIGKEVLNSALPDMKAENNTLLFDGNGIPQYPYIDHQTFILNGSLYSQNVVTPTGISQASADNLYNGLSKWTYKEVTIPFDHDGHDGTNNDDSNDHDYIASLDIQTNDPNLARTLAASNLSQDAQAYILSRKTLRYMPMQIMTSSEYKVSNQQPTTQTLPQGIHWLCQKQTPLYAGEDFFVEFLRLADKPDVVSGSNPMLSQYQMLDSKYNNGASQDATINGGVVELTEQGTVSPVTTDTFDLNNQPYYLIEIGMNDAKHDYFIIIAYNANPILVQVGNIPTIKIGTGTGTTTNPPGPPTTAPQVITSRDKISKRLSTYKDVSSKDLMDQNTLRVTVREHLGQFVITFNGHEDNPWIISRTDLVPTSLNSSSSSSTSAPTSVSEINVPMEIAAQPIQIGAGNLKCGFMFSPLHYQDIVTFKQPNYITVRGPIVDEKSLNILLGDQGTQNPAYIGATTHNAMRYFQDAENYCEVIKGKLQIKEKRNSNPIWPIKAVGKDTFAVDLDNMTNADGEYISYIQIAMASPLSSYGGSSSSASASGDFLKWLNVEFALGSGDSTFKPIQLTIENRKSTLWRVWNCITPIATGWRLYVAQNNEVYSQAPVDVAQHVDHFNHSWSYTDNAKLEHTGNIRFRINAGTATSLVNAPANGYQDESIYLANLSNKMFYVRIYAWWSGGYMDCQYSPNPCTVSGNNTDVSRVLFTGLAFGGDITVEGQIRYMECQLFDYMKIVQDQYFLNSPFFDGMSDYHAAAKIIEMAGFNVASPTQYQTANAHNVNQSGTLEHYPPAMLINQIMDRVSAQAQNPSTAGDTFTIGYFATGEQIVCAPYVLPSSYDTLQNPFMKFADGSKYDEALSKIGIIAGKVAYFDRFGVFRYDVRPDSLFFWVNQGFTLAQTARSPVYDFYASPWALKTAVTSVPECSRLSLLALETYTYKKCISDMVNDILLLTTTPDGAYLVNSVVNFQGRYDPTSPGYIGYTKRLLQMDGIFGSEQALLKISAYYAAIMFQPPTVLTWKSMGMPQLKAMDIVTFTGLLDDKGFPVQNVDSPQNFPKTTITVIITSLSSEINPEKNEWINTYEGEWLYGNITQPTPG